MARIKEEDLSEEDQEAMRRYREADILSITFVSATKPDGRTDYRRSEAFADSLYRESLQEWVYGDSVLVPTILTLHKGDGIAEMGMKGNGDKLATLLNRLAESGDLVIKEDEEFPDTPYGPAVRHFTVYSPGRVQ